MTLPNTLRNECLQTAAKDLIPITFFQKSGSIAIQNSTIGTTTAPDIYSYAPSAGQIVHVTRIQLMLWDNTAWGTPFYFADHNALLTDGIDIRYSLNAPWRTIITDSVITNGPFYIDSTESLFSRMPLDMNLQLLSPQSWTADDRAFLFYRDLNRQRIILNGDSGDNIYFAIRESLSAEAVEVIWATIEGFLI